MDLHTGQTVDREREREREVERHRKRVGGRGRESGDYTEGGVWRQCTLNEAFLPTGRVRLGVFHSCGYFAFSSRLPIVLLKKNFL